MFCSENAPAGNIYGSLSCMINVKVKANQFSLQFMHLKGAHSLQFINIRIYEPRLGLQ